MDGKRAGPLEDCGGVWGYYSVLEALNDPANADEDFLEWIGDYDPEYFDIEELNEELKNVFTMRENFEENGEYYYDSEDYLLKYLETAYESEGIKGITKAIDMFIKESYLGQGFTNEEKTYIKAKILEQTPFWYAGSEFVNNNSIKKFVKSMLKRKIINNINIEKGLKLLSPGELNVIKDTYKVPENFSIVKLKNIMLQKLPEYIEQVFCLYEVRYFYDIFEEEGSYLLENVYDFAIAKLLQYTGMGYIGMKKAFTHFIFYEEVKKYVKKQQNFLEKMEILENKRNFIENLVFLYGVIEKEKLLKIINRKKYKDILEVPITEKDLEFFEKTNNDLPEIIDLAIVKRNGVDYIVHKAAYDIFEEILDYRKKYIENDYKIFSADYIREMVDKGFYSNNIIERLERELKHMLLMQNMINMDTINTIDIIKDIFVYINHNVSNNQINEYLVSNGIIERPWLKTLLNDFKRIAPKWHFKGYSK
nr:hypothetical protein [Marinitoga lauensis]